MNRCRLAGLLHPLAAAAALATTGAWAQTAGSGGDGSATDLPKVEITASKRKQLVLDVPYAVTAISAAEIQDRGVLDIKDLQSSVPSLFITENGPGQSRVQLRGMSTVAGLPTVGSYLDEMTISLDQVQRAIDVPLVDMARIEVLRGPQGTLYGDGSLGGTIRYITRNPKLNTTEFSAEAGIRSLRHGEAGYFTNAVANLPLAADTAALRLVAGYEKLPGWVDNSVAGAAQQKDINGGDREYVRGKFFTKLGRDADASLMLYHYKLGQDNPTAARADDTVPSYIPAPSKDKVTLANLVVNADFGFATMTSSTGYTQRSLLQAFDVTDFFHRVLPVSLLPANAAIALRTAMDFKILTEELRLVSNDSGPFTWLAGAYYRSSDSSQVRSTPSTAPSPITILDQTGTSPVDSRQFAVFGEATYALTPTLSLTGGLRYFRDRQDLSSTGAGGVTTTDRASFHATSPRLNVLWKYAANASLYATVSKGFRSGGFNTTPPPSYGPESLWNYEIGGKGSTLGGKLQYDAALYYVRYDQVQSLDIPAGGLFATTVNTGKASGPGADLTIVAELARGLTLDASLSWVGFEYDVTTADRNKGDPLNYIPKMTAALGLTSRFQWPGLNVPGMVRLDYQHADAAPLIVRNQGLNTKTDPANYVNLRVGIELPRWQAYLEGRNLTNFNGIVNPAAGAQTENVRPMPRSLGVTVRAQF
jgi:outer membrane receptor protein involved in Fe transport